MYGAQAPPARRPPRKEELSAPPARNPPGREELYERLKKLQRQGFCLLCLCAPCSFRPFPPFFGCFSSKASLGHSQPSFFSINLTHFPRIRFPLGSRMSCSACRRVRCTARIWRRNFTHQVWGGRRQTTYNILRAKLSLLLFTVCSSRSAI